MSLGDLGISTVNGGAIGVKNAIINGNFAVNQRGVSGTVTLAAGAYGHDRFKAGASGCTYTFATANNITTLTISAGSLIQVIEGNNLFTGTYTLSWVGTAQGKIGGGSYASSGVTGTPAGGTDLNIEFNTGTLSLVQFEPGAIATPFERRPFGDELVLCQRYFEKSYNIDVAPGTASTGYSAFSSSGSAGGLTTAYLDTWLPFKVTKRSTPTMAAWDEANNSGTCTRVNPGVLGTSGQNLAFGSSGVASLSVSSVSGANAGRFLFNWTASAEL
jgi:hypothetical protein